MDITWTCEICGETRPDQFISVFITDISVDHGLKPGIMFQNIKYCNDRPACSDAAPTFRLEGLRGWLKRPN